MPINLTAKFKYFLLKIYTSTHELASRTTMPKTHPNYPYCQTYGYHFMQEAWNNSIIAL